MKRLASSRDGTAIYISVINPVYNILFTQFISMYLHNCHKFERVLSYYRSLHYVMVRCVGIPAKYYFTDHSFYVETV